MTSKEQALIELETAIIEFGLKKTEVGMAICGNRSFMDLMRDPDKSITTNTLDKINRYVLKLRNQGDLPL